MYFHELSTTNGPRNAMATAPSSGKKMTRLRRLAWRKSISASHQEHIDEDGDPERGHGGVALHVAVLESARGGPNRRDQLRGAVHEKAVDEHHVDDAPQATSGRPEGLHDDPVVD